MEKIIEEAVRRLQEQGINAQLCIMWGGGARILAIVLGGVPISEEILRDCVQSQNAV